MKMGNAEIHAEAWSSRRESNSPTSAPPREKRKGWQTKPFEECIESVKYTRKIQRKDFLDDGQFPIVSQEAEFTNGYWDDEADVFKVTTQRLARIYERKLALLTALKKSLLHRAFEGWL